jgi:hypothetical protein
MHIVGKLWDRAKGKLTQEDLNQKLLVDRNIWENTSWHIAAANGNLKVLLKQWEWSKEVLMPQELKNEFLLAAEELEDPFPSTDN